MHNKEYKKEKVVKYLIFTFGLAYMIQIAVWLLYKNGNIGAGQLVMAGMMFVPLLGVLFADGDIKNMGWKPNIRQNVKSILIAWFVPAILTALGCVLYFLFFPKHFDLSGSFLAASAGEQALEQLRAQGITYPMYVIITAISSVTYAPVINALPALGEETGWRGFLYPQLKIKYGKKKGCLLGGIIWGAWHWPLIWLIGYEYGSEYIGFPITGMLLFCIFTIISGALSDWLYEQSQSIWLPSIFHGAINAAATIPLAICSVMEGTTRLLGPAPNGLIGGLPLFIFVLIILLKEK